MQSVILQDEDLLQVHVGQPLCFTLKHICVSVSHAKSGHVQPMWARLCVSVGSTVDAILQCEFSTLSLINAKRFFCARIVQACAGPGLPFYGV